MLVLNILLSLIYFLFELFCILNKKIVDVTSGEFYRDEIVGEPTPEIIRQYFSSSILYRACIKFQWNMAIQTAILQNAVDVDKETDMLLLGPTELFHDKYGEDFLN